MIFVGNFPQDDGHIMKGKTPFAGDVGATAEDKDGPDVLYIDDFHPTLTLVPHFFTKATLTTTKHYLLNKIFYSDICRQ